MMSTTLTGEFETRREAEMAVERLVQEHGIDRGKIQIAATGSQNSAGTEEAGSDTAAGEPTPESRDDAALNGAIAMTVEIENTDAAASVRSAFSEFDASDVDDG